MEGEAFKRYLLACDTVSHGGRLHEFFPCLDVLGEYRDVFVEFGGEKWGPVLGRFIDLVLSNWGEIEEAVDGGGCIRSVLHRFFEAFVGDEVWEPSIHDVLTISSCVPVRLKGVGGDRVLYKVTPEEMESGLEEVDLSSVVELVWKLAGRSLSCEAGYRAVLAGKVYDLDLRACMKVLKSLQPYSVAQFVADDIAGKLGLPVEGVSLPLTTYHPIDTVFDPSSLLPPHLLPARLAVQVYRWMDYPDVSLKVAVASDRYLIWRKVSVQGDVGGSVLRALEGMVRAVEERYEDIETLYRVAREVGISLVPVWGEEMALEYGEDDSVLPSADSLKASIVSPSSVRGVIRRHYLLVGATVAEVESLLASRVRDCRGIRSVTVEAGFDDNEDSVVVEAEYEVPTSLLADTVSCIDRAFEEVVKRVQEVIRGIRERVGTPSIVQVIASFLLSVTVDISSYRTLGRSWEYVTGRIRGFLYNMLGERGLEGLLLETMLDTGVVEVDGHVKVLGVPLEEVVRNLLGDDRVAREVARKVHEYVASVYAYMRDTVATSNSSATASTSDSADSSPHRSTPRATAKGS